MSDFRRAIEHWPPDWRDAYEERAAIIEFDGRERRAKAEYRAYWCIKQAMEESNGRS